jgi:hypothetical protein
MNKLLVINGGASVKPDNRSAYLKFADPKSFFERANFNNGDLLVYDAILKALSYDAIQDIQFIKMGDQTLWPKEAPTATIIRGSNYLIEDLDLSHTVPLLKKLQGPIVPIGIGAQASTYRKLKFSSGTVEAWRIIASKCTSIGVRGAYSAEVLNDIGIKNVRVIGCPSFYRSLRPSLSIRKIDPTNARVGLTLNRYLSKEYATNAIKTNRLQQALLEAVARRPNSRLYSQGEREESLAVFSPPDQRSKHVDTILNRFGLKDNAACQSLFMERMFAFLDVDEWTKDAAEQIDVMVGFRLHGNVIALHQGIPAVFFTYDSRIRELAALFAAPAIEVEDYLPLDLDRILSAMDFKAMEHAYRLNFAEYHQFLTENGLLHRLPTPVAPPAGKPLSTLNTVKVEYSPEEMTSWLRQEIDFLSKENQTLRDRAWNLEIALREAREKLQAEAKAVKVA